MDAERQVASVPTQSGEPVKGLPWFIQENHFLAIHHTHVPSNAGDVVAAPAVQQRNEQCEIIDSVECQRQIVVPQASQHSHIQSTLTVLVSLEPSGDAICACIAVKYKTSSPRRLNA